MVHSCSIANGHPIDLGRLLETRMLVQANSGGGKSWALRRILEQTAPMVQQLVIDPEGEFATLREKFDYVICAPHDADAIASPRTAALLARRLLETGVSAILDIYDLKAHERQLFVERFLTALVNAPKALWHPVLIVLDEAHVFAPEKGSSESTGAVIDVATRGRKRGQSLIVATQRLAKLHKDVAAEMLNKLIGRTGLDVDVKRAADELGMTPREAMEQLRPLSPGEFYLFGPALSLRGLYT
jgi:DNA helicase HerA-like ATPase